MNKDKEIFERTYEKPDVVWTTKKPPKELVELIESKKIKPCKVLDIGCGEGFYSVYLALKGFDVTGIDISEKAIQYAKENAKKQGADVKFKALDIANLSELEEKFDFVFEWALMHHIMPSERQKYVEDVSKILKKGGKYFSICFNVKNPDFDAMGRKYRTVPRGAAVPAGMRLYYSSLEELKKLFKPHFKVIEAKLVKMTTGTKPHIGNYFFMERL